MGTTLPAMPSQLREPMTSVIRANEAIARNSTEPERRGSRHAFQVVGGTTEGGRGVRAVAGVNIM